MQRSCRGASEEGDITFPLVTAHLDILVRGSCEVDACYLEWFEGLNTFSRKWSLNFLTTGTVRNLAWKAVM
jgi:hypothetical protein